MTVVEETAAALDTIDAPNGTVETALDMAEWVESVAKFNSRDPAGLAAACVYAASLVTNAGVTQRQAAAASGVSTATVGNLFHKVLANYREDDRGRAVDKTDSGDRLTALGLFEELWVLKRTPEQVSEAAGVGVGLVRERMESFGIPVPPRDRSGETDLSVFQRQLRRELKDRRDEEVAAVE